MLKVKCFHTVSVRNWRQYFLTIFMPPPILQIEGTGGHYVWGCPSIHLCMLNSYVCVCPSGQRHLLTGLPSTSGVKYCLRCCKFVLSASVWCDRVQIVHQICQNRRNCSVTTVSLWLMLLLSQ